MKPSNRSDAASAAILVGAGISKNSAVPLFEAFRNAFLEPILGQSTVNIDVFPPEQLFYRLSRLGRKYERSVISTLLEYSFDRLPNLNHFALCEAIEAGASVWTTNYDTLIEKAAFSMGLRCHALAWPESPYCACGDLHFFKMHGSFHQGDIASQKLIFQSSDVLQQMRSDWESAFTNSFKDSDVLIAGYKGNDIDVMPVLKKCVRESSSTVLWFELEGAVTPRQAKSLPKLTFVLGDPSFEFRCHLVDRYWLDGALAVSEASPDIPMPSPVDFPMTHAAKAALLGQLERSESARKELRQSILHDPFQLRFESLGKLVQSICLENRYANFFARKLSISLVHVPLPFLRDSAWFRYLLLNETYGTRDWMSRRIRRHGQRQAVKEWGYGARVSAFSHLKLIGDFAELDKYIDISEYVTQLPSLQGKAVFNILWVLRNQGRLAEWRQLVAQFEDRAPYLDPNWTAWFDIERADLMCMLGRGRDGNDALQSEAVRFAKSRAQPLFDVDARVAQTRSDLLVMGSQSLDFTVEFQEQYLLVVNSKRLNTPFRRSSFALTWAASLKVTNENQSLVKQITERVERESSSLLHKVLLGLLRIRHSLQGPSSADELLEMSQTIGFGYGEALVAREAQLGRDSSRSSGAKEILDSWTEVEEIVWVVP